MTSPSLHLKTEDYVEMEEVCKDKPLGRSDNAWSLGWYGSLLVLGDKTSANNKRHEKHRVWGKRLT